jgi:hypothetical protein
MQTAAKISTFQKNTVKTMFFGTNEKRRLPENQGSLRVRWHKIVAHIWHMKLEYA